MPRERPQFHGPSAATCDLVAAQKPCDNNAPIGGCGRRRDQRQKPSQQRNPCWDFWLHQQGTRSTASATPPIELATKRRRNSKAKRCQRSQQCSCSGLIADSEAGATELEAARRALRRTGMFNNHSFGSADHLTHARGGWNTEEEVVKDRGDSDSASSNFGSSDESEAISQSFQNQQIAVRLGQRQHDQQQGQQLIIPKRLSLDENTESTTTIDSTETSSNTGTRVSQQRWPQRPIQATGRPSPQQDRHSSDNWDRKEITDVGTVSDEVSADSSELIFGPTKSSSTRDLSEQRRAARVLRYQTVPDAFAPQSAPLSTTTTNRTKQGKTGSTRHPGDPVSRSQSNRRPASETPRETEQQPVEIVPSRRQRQRRQQRAAGVPEPPSSATVAEPHPGESHSLISLCTSSSNCCRAGGLRAGKRRDNSPESSLDLACGVPVLCRPGSLPGLNIDGLSVRRLRCVHDKAVRGSAFTPDPEVQEEDEEEPSTRRPREGKKTVSFSTSLPKGLKDDTKMELGVGKSSSSGAPQSNKMTFDLVNTDTEVSDIESDARPCEEGASPSGFNNRQSGHLETAFEAVAFEDTNTANNYRMETAEVDAAATQLPLVEKAAQVQKARPFSKTDATVAAAKRRPSKKTTENASNLVITHAAHSKGRQSVASSFRLSVDPQMAANTEEQPVAANEGPRPTSGSNAATVSHVEAAPNRPKALETLKSRQLTQPVRCDKVFSVGSECSDKLVNNCSSAISSNESLRKFALSSGSNCANSTATQALLPRSQRSSNTRSTGYHSWTGRRTEDSTTVDDHSSSDADSSYIIFQHPPEKENAASKSMRLYDSPGAASLIDDRGLQSDTDSIDFSWITSLHNNSVDAVCRTVSAENNSSNVESMTSSRNQYDIGGHNSSVGKVTLSRLTTLEDRLCSIDASPPKFSRLRNAEVSGDCYVMPSAVQDFATAPSVAESVARAESNESSASSESAESESSSQTFLMLEALSCGHKNKECCSRAAASNSRRCPLIAASAMAKPPSPPPQSQSILTQSMTSSIAAPTSAAAAATVAADARCSTLDSEALTRALIRGLVSNVESLRSALTAALLLLKDRHRCSGPLAQAICAADTLDELVHQVLTAQQQQQQQHLHHQLRRHHHHHQAADEGSKRARQQQEPRQRFASDARGGDGGSDGGECHHAMAHYVVGEQFVEPSLERWPALQCCPTVSRVVPSESNGAVSLAADSRRRRRLRAENEGKNNSHRFRQSIY